MNLSVLPFSLQLPSGYSLAAENGGTPSPTASSAATVASPTATQAGSPTTDVVSISNSFDAGTFTAVAGDTFSLSALVQGQVGKPGAVAGYRIGLGGGSGHLLLNGSDVTDRTSFTADEFAHLTYRTGTDGSQQSLVIVAQTGIRQRDGRLTQEVDSPAVQITADVTGSRSINAMNALRTAPTGTDANIVGIVQQAGIFSGFGGSARLSLQTDGNFSAVAGDVYRMSALFAAAGPTGQTIAGYRVALGDGDGKLLLSGVDVSDRTSFSADEFAHLTYTAGADGSQQSLLVIAQTGKRLSEGTLSREVDSTAVQITADVTGSRSINAMNALRTQPTGADADIAGIVQQSGIFSGFGGSARPTVQTDGNFRATAGDIYRMSGLFKASVPTGQTIAGYRVALGDGGGTLQLGGVDVSDRTSFSANEFARLSYTAGADGSQQSLLVIAQTGTRGRDGSLSQEIDSAAVQITADVTDNRSINAMNALSTVPSRADARIVGVVEQAGIFNVLVGSTPPTLRTDGNFTAVAGDALRLSNLFKASAPAGKAIAGYQVALGDGDGKLSLNGSDVSDRTSFTADEFAHLTYTMGADGSQQSLVVVAQTGTRRSDGSLSQEVDSAPVQIAAAASGSRSINAMAALRTTPTGEDADIVGIVQQAGIFQRSRGIDATHDADRWQLHRRRRRRAEARCSVQGERDDGQDDRRIPGGAGRRRRSTAAERQRRRGPHQLHRRRVRAPDLYDGRRRFAAEPHGHRPDRHARARWYAEPGSRQRRTADHGGRDGRPLDQCVERPAHHGRWGRCRYRRHRATGRDLQRSPGNGAARAADRGDGGTVHVTGRAGDRNRCVQYGRSGAGQRRNRPVAVLLGRNRQFRFAGRPCQPWRITCSRTAAARRQHDRRIPGRRQSFRTSGGNQGLHHLHRSVTDVASRGASSAVLGCSETCQLSAKRKSLDYDVGIILTLLPHRRAVSPAVPPNSPDRAHR
jgi:hypothetical protein